MAETAGTGTTAARMSGTGTVLQQFVSGLKSRNEDTRAKAAKDLQHYVTTELREVRDTIHLSFFHWSPSEFTVMHVFTLIPFDFLPTLSFNCLFNALQNT